MRIKLTGEVENTVTTMRIGVQSTSFRCRFWTTAVRVQSVKGDQVPTLSFLEWNFKDPTDEGLLLVNYIRTNASWNGKMTTLKHLANKWEKLITDVEVKADDVKPESFTIPQVLSKPWGIVTHSSWWHTQSVPRTKKYLLFQFLLESGISDTSLKSFFQAAKW